MSNMRHCGSKQPIVFVVAAAAVVLFTLRSFVTATTLINADVLIGAGHEGRPQSCKRFPQHKCNLGTAGERALTAAVADEATNVLRAAGLSVARVPADFSGVYEVKDAIFIHFDGDESACASGASIGYHHARDKAAADAWRALYQKHWQFRFQPDNFTDNLRNYYAFRQVQASDAALVLELGELTCAPQKSWLDPRIRWAGDLIAYFVSRRTGKGAVREPATP